MNHRPPLTAAVVSAAAALAVAAGQAGAAPVVHNPRGQILGIAPHRAAAQRAAQAKAKPVLADHGGPVMHSNTTHAIFWEPPGYSFADADPAYESIIDAFLADVAAASGSSDNVYSVSTQYSDGSASAAYDSHFAGPVTTHDPLPASGCDGGDGEPCLTDAQLRTEIQNVLSADNLPTGLGDIYLLYTPPGIDSCTDSSASDCSNSNAPNGFCGYHDYVATSDSWILYANLPYPTTGCDTGESPQGDRAADDIVSTTTHEQNETITDPLGTAWWVDSGADAGDEEADICNFDFGTGYGPDPVEQNQTIDGDPYYVQLLWSNVDSDCAPSYPLYFSASAGSATVAQSLSFTAAPGYSSYTWDFGDGGTATGISATHSYTAPGSYSVELTAQQGTNPAVVATRTVIVGAPSCQSTNVSLASAAAGPTTIELPCGDGPSYRIVGSGASHGTLSAIDSSHSVTYTPAQHFAGSDGFDYEATDSNGAAGAGAVTISVGGAPEDHVAPAISGTGAVGTLLSATVGWWTAVGTIDYSYDWERCDASGANCLPTLAPDASTYLLSNADVGHTLRVAVSASNGASTSALSAPSAVVFAVSPPPPKTQQKRTRAITDVGISTAVLRAGAAKRLSARVRYRLTRAGTVTFTLERGVAGARRTSGCVPARHGRARRRCMAFVYVARTLRRKQHAGTHRASLASLFGERSLSRGSYRVELAARAAGGGKTIAYVSFEVR